LFTPEFRNRIDEFIYFNDLSKADVFKIAKLHLKQYPVAQTEELIEYIVNNAYSKEYGVRELKRFIKANVALLVAEAILERRVPIDGSRNYTVEFKDNKLQIVNTVQAPTKAATT
jgi:ATP-dependent Clp protease ATP-binding subunit ClpA